MNIEGRAVFSLEGPVRGATIACDSGTLWITQAGDIRDYVIRAGMNFTVPGEGSVAIQLMGRAGVTVRLPDSYPGRLQRLFRKWVSSGRPIRRLDGSALPRLRDGAAVASGRVRIVFKGGGG